MTSLRSIFYCHSAQFYTRGESQNFTDFTIVFYFLFQTIQSRLLETEKKREARERTKKAYTACIGPYPAANQDQQNSQRFIYEDLAEMFNKIEHTRIFNWRPEDTKRSGNLGARGCSAESLHRCTCRPETFPPNKVHVWAFYNSCCLKLLLKQSTLKVHKCLCLNILITSGIVTLYSL